VSALDEYRKYVDEVRDDYSEYNPAFHIILKADAAIAELEATIERLAPLERFQHGVTTCPACHAVMRWEQGEVVEWAERGR
jgi:hypothetical protein